MVLLIDPYANRHLSMADIRLVNQVAGALFEEVEDPAVLIRAIHASYRRGMDPAALKTHVQRHLRNGKNK
jgi:hypothetical protein